MSDEQTPDIVQRLETEAAYLRGMGFDVWPDLALEAARQLTEERRARAEAEQQLKAIGDIISLDNPVSDEMKAVPLVQDMLGLSAAHITERKRRREAEQENARLRSQSEWQPIDTAPKDGRTILVYFPSMGIWAVEWSAEVFDDGAWSVSDNKSQARPLRGWSAPPTHWMPLPAPPRAALSGGERAKQK